MSLENKQRSKFTVRTSDRRSFRRCQRKWYYTSSLGKNLEEKGTEQNINFWFGSAIHFAMEDFHGWNKFGDPRRAFKAYYDAFAEQPPGAETHYGLGLYMLTYYLVWLERHNKDYGFETLWLNSARQAVPPHTPGAQPAVEQGFNLPLGIKVITAKASDEILAIYQEGVTEYNNGLFVPLNDSTGYWLQSKTAIPIECSIIPIMYHGTMDRIVVDKKGRWWILDYKTAKSADTNKLDTDDQISAYLWAAELWFQHPIEGFVYLQLTKDVVRAPKRLKNGTLSVDKRQKTTYSLFKEALIEDYGTVSKAPSKMVDLLNLLATKEEPEGDRFIRWDLVRRNKAQIESTFKHIQAEVYSMLTSTHPYPNPTRDCIWDCSIRDICLALDKQENDLVANWLQTEWQERSRTEDGNIDEWRKNIKWCTEPKDLIPIEELLSAVDKESFTIILDSQEAQDETSFTFLYGD